MAALGVRLRDAQLAFPAMRALVRLAERLGYESVWLPESHGREVLTELTALALEQAWQHGDATAAANAVTRPMMQALTIYGSAAECRQRLQAYRDAGLQLPIIAPFPIGEPVQETFARTIEGCA
jgi:alkanesulfonate monooxygenase SsuD/methylene tetrahydromethanopterin reductase-like flavin-dependent oxidoreductase (luciferase family)